MADFDLSNLLPTPITSATPEQIQSMREYATAMMKGQPHQGPYTWANALDTISSKLLGAAMWRRAGELQKGGLEEGAKSIPTFDASSSAGAGTAPTPTAPAASAPPATAPSADQTAATPEGGVASSARAPTPMEANDTLGFIKKWEGFDSTAKWDYKQYSGGYGSRAEKGQTFTPETAHAALVDSVQPISKFIGENVKVPLSPGQRTALTSFAYNVGTGDGGLSDLIPDINKGDWPSVAAKMQHYNHAGGKVKVDLTRRRADEARMIAFGAPPAAPSPQAIGPIVNALAGPSGATTTFPMAPGAPGAPGGLTGPTGASITLPANSLAQGAAPGGNAPQSIGGMIKYMGGVPSPALSPTGALAPQQAAVNAIAGGGGPALAGGPGQTAMTSAIAGGSPRAATPQATPDFMPPTPGLPPLPTPAEIQAGLRSNIPQYVEIAKANQEYRLKALAPTQYVDPRDGTVWFGNQYTGFHRSPMRGLPQTQMLPIEAGGVKIQQPYTWGTGAQGQPVLNPVQTMTHPAMPGAAPSAPGATDEFPTGGSVGEMVEWANRQKTRLAEQEGYARKTGETYATKQGIIEKRAADAQDELPQLQTLQKVIHDPAFYSGWKAGNVEAMSSALRMVGYSGDTASLMQYAKKLGSAASLENIREMGESGAVRIPEMHMIEKSNFDIENTPAANAAIVDIRMRIAQRQLETANLANQYANKHGGVLDRGFDQIKRDYYEANPLFSKAEIDRYDHILTNRKPPEGGQAAVANANAANVPPAAIAQLGANPTPERMSEFERHFGLHPGTAMEMLKRLPARPAPPQAPLPGPAGPVQVIPKPAGPAAPQAPASPPLDLMGSP